MSEESSEPSPDRLFPAGLKHGPQHEESDPIPAIQRLSGIVNQVRTRIENVEGEVPELSEKIDVGLERVAGKLDEQDREIYDLWGAVEGYPSKPMPRWEGSLRLAYEVFDTGWLGWSASSRLLLEGFDGWFEFTPSGLIAEGFDGWFPWEGGQVLITEDFEGADWP